MSLTSAIPADDVGALGSLELIAAAGLAAHARGVTEGCASLRVPAAPAPLCVLEVGFASTHGADGRRGGLHGGIGITWGDDGEGNRFCLAALTGPAGLLGSGAALPPPGATPFGAAWFPWLIGSPLHCTYSLAFQVVSDLPPADNAPAAAAGGAAAGVCPLQQWRLSPPGSEAAAAPPTVASPAPPRVTVVASGAPHACLCTPSSSSASSSSSGATLGDPTAPPPLPRCRFCAPHPASLFPSAATGAATDAPRECFSIPVTVPASAVGFVAGPLMEFDRPPPTAAAAAPPRAPLLSARGSDDGRVAAPLPSPLLHRTLSRASSAGGSVLEGAAAGTRDAGAAAQFLCSAALLRLHGGGAGGDGAASSADASSSSILMHARRSHRLVAYLSDWLAAPLPCGPLFRHVYLPPCILPSAAALAATPTSLGSGTGPGAPPAALLWAAPERDVVSLAGLALYPDELLAPPSEALDTASTAHALQVSTVVLLQQPPLPRTLPICCFSCRCRCCHFCRHSGSRGRGLAARLQRRWAARATATGRLDSQPRVTRGCSMAWQPTPQPPICAHCGATVTTRSHWPPRLRPPRGSRPQCPAWRQSRLGRARRPHSGAQLACSRRCGRNTCVGGLGAGCWVLQ